MEMQIGFLDQLGKDLRAAAARERLAIDETERRGASPFPGLGGRGRRGRGRRRPWLMATAAALSLLVLAGSVGFLATGGFDTLRMATPAAESPAFATGAAATAGGEPQEALGSGGGGAARAGDTVRQANLAGNGNAQYDAFAGDTDQAAPAPATAPEHAGTASADLAATNAPRQYRDLSKIVRTGRIGVVVDNGRFETAAARIREIAAANNGSVTDSSTRTRVGTFTLRIPERHFDDTITDLSELGTVQFLAQNSQDVTAEFVDNAARLRILKERREVLEGFLKNADTEAEVLRFFDAVQNVQLDIERLQGQQRYLNDQVAISTITVQLRERDAKLQPEPVDQPSIGHAWERGIQGFLNVVGAVVIGLGYLLPLLVLGGIGFGIVWLVRRRRTAS